MTANTGEIQSTWQRQCKIYVQKITRLRAGFWILTGWSS